MTDEELLARAKRDREYHKRYNRVRWRAMAALAKRHPEEFDELIGEMMFREDNDQGNCQETKKTEAVDIGE